MRTQFESILKTFFYEHQTKTRAALHLTQAQMAKLLKMELRSYSDLDQCKSSCSALTLACYLIYCCENPISFLSDLHLAFKALSDMEPRFICLSPHSESLSYRLPLKVTEVLVTGDGEHFPVCPRCGITLEREFTRFCDRCGQKLDWINYPKSATVQSVRGKHAKQKNKSEVNV